MFKDYQAQHYTAKPLMAQAKDPKIHVGQITLIAINQGYNDHIVYSLVDEDFQEDWIGTFVSNSTLSNPAGASAVLQCYAAKGLDVALALALFIRLVSARHCKSGPFWDAAMLQEYVRASIGFAEYAEQVEKCLQRLDNLKAFW